MTTITLWDFWSRLTMPPNYVGSIPITLSVDVFSQVSSCLATGLLNPRLGMKGNKLQKAMPGIRWSILGYCTYWSPNSVWHSHRWVSRSRCHQFFPFGFNSDLTLSSDGHGAGLSGTHGHDIAMSWTVRPLFYSKYREVIEKIADFSSQVIPLPFQVSLACWGWKSPWKRMKFRNPSGGLGCLASGCW